MTSKSYDNKNYLPMKNKKFRQRAPLTNHGTNAHIMISTNRNKMKHLQLYGGRGGGDTTIRYEITNLYSLLFFLDIDLMKTQTKVGKLVEPRRVRLATKGPPQNMQGAPQCPFVHTETHHLRQHRNKQYHC